MNDLFEQRLRLADITDVSSVASPGGPSGDQTLVAITSSHLGHSRALHRSVCQYLSRCLLEAKRQRATVVIAAGSAIAPWMERAAELFGVDVVWLCLGDELVEGVSTRQRWSVSGEASVNRDELLIAVADRVECLAARRGGKIEAAIMKRLARRPDASVRIAVHHETLEKQMRSARERLMDHGAVGWYRATRGSRRKKRVVTQRADNDWMRTTGQWLVHCTRAPAGPWPGQSMRQYRDGLLLGSDTDSDGDAGVLAALARILRMRRLAASAITSRRAFPVVCFSQLALDALLDRRTFRPHLHRWDYEPYGIAIRKSAAVAAGIRPVIYVDTATPADLPSQDRYRIQAKGKTYDWSSECEWRHLGDVDLDRFAKNDVRVFVNSDSDADQLSTEFAISVVSNQPK